MQKQIFEHSNSEADTGFKGMSPLHLLIKLTRKIVKKEKITGYSL